MDFEEKIKLAIEMAEYRIDKSGRGLGGVLPTTDTYQKDDYARAVQGMFALIQELEETHNTSTAS